MHGRKHYGYLAAALIMLFCVLMLAACGVQIQREGGSMLEAEILKVGKADAIILTVEDHAVVIDAGEEDDGEEVCDCLRKKGVSRVDVLIITHFDKDHIGGADTLTEKMDVRRILLPAYEGSGEEYEDFLRAVEEKNLVPERLTEPAEFTLGSCGFLVEPPSSYLIPEGNGEYDNDFSLITTVEYGENRLIFMGDAEKKRIREWLSGDGVRPCDFLKMPHHGVYESALKDLLEELKPSFAVICSSKKNPAQEKTLELLEKSGVLSYETKDGDVHVTCDGKKVKVYQ